jgi:hypothetical protein
MNGWTKGLVIVALVLLAVGMLWTPQAQAHWGVYHGWGGYHHWAGYPYRVGYARGYVGYPYPTWQYMPTVTLPPTYVYPPYGTYYWGNYPYSATYPVGAYRYTYPY